MRTTSENAEARKHKYYHKQTWTDEYQTRRHEFRGTSRKKDGLKWQFILDKHGKVVYQARLTEIRDTSRRKYVGWDIKYNGNMPCSWRNVPLEDSGPFKGELSFLFPELRPCEGDWMADLVCTLTYLALY